MLPSHHDRPKDQRGSLSNLATGGPQFSRYGSFSGPTSPFGRSSAHIGDPEAGVEGGPGDHLRRRGSMFQTFSEELKKSWTSLGNLTVQAASAFLNAHPAQPKSETEEASGSTYAAYDEESGAGEPSDSRGGLSQQPDQVHFPGGLRAYRTTSQEAVGVDKRFIPRNAGWNAGPKNIDRTQSGILPSYGP